jgi:flavin reductase
MTVSNECLLPPGGILSPAALAGAPAILPPEARRYRDAMARLGAAVHIVTTDGPAGRAGFTASAVCSVTDTPPTLLVCLNRASSAYAACLGNGVVCVNTLASGQETLSQAFGGKTAMDERFAAGRWSRGATGAPCLHGALATFDCRIVSVATVGHARCPVLRSQPHPRRRRRAVPGVLRQALSPVVTKKRVCAGTGRAIAIKIGASP